MTEQQKAENQAAAKVRDRAHTARRRALRDAVEMAENSPEVNDLRKAFEEAEQAADAETARVDSQIQALEQRIAEIRAEIKGLVADRNASGLHDKRRAAATAWDAAKRAKVEAAEVLFPDLMGAARWSAAGWTPPPEVLAEMEKARRGATPKAATSKAQKPEKA